MGLHHAKTAIFKKRIVLSQQYEKSSFKFKCEVLIQLFLFLAVSQTTIIFKSLAISSLDRAIFTFQQLNSFVGWELSEEFQQLDENWVQRIFPYEVGKNPLRIGFSLRKAVFESKLLLEFKIIKINKNNKKQN